MRKKEFSTEYIVCFLISVVMSMAITIIGTVGIIGSLAFRECAQNEEKLYLVAFVIEQEYDCKIIEVIHDYGKATLLAQPNNGKEPYLVNLEVKEISPFTYEWVGADY